MTSFRHPASAARAGLALAGALFWGCCALADIVVLKSGWKTEGIASETATHVEVTLKSGHKVRYERGDVEEIIRQKTPGQVFEDKYAATDRKDPRALADLAAWCRTNGLGEEAARVARDILEINPNDTLAKNILIRQKMTVENIAANPERDRALAAAYGRGFRIYSSRHFRIAYNTDEDYARERAVLLETLYEQFFRHFDGLGLEPRFIEDRLEVVLFKNRMEYAAFAAAIAPALAQSGGFYSTTDNRSFFFDATGGPEFAAAERQYTACMRQLQTLRNQVSIQSGSTRFEVTEATGERKTMTRDGLRRHIAELQQKASAQWQAFQAARQEINASVTLHECAHQLAFNLGVHPNAESTPRWLAEGIATFFEKTPIARQAKATGENAEWSKTIRERLAGALPLSEFLNAEEAFLRFDQATETAYAQSWALFRFLSERRPADLAGYLRLLAKRETRARPQERVEEFERAFGPVDKVESEWRAWAQALPAK